MNNSIRYGPTPPDLVVGTPPKATYGVYVAQTFIPLRARIDGAWRLGVAREWVRDRSHGWLVRIETVDGTKIETVDGTSTVGVRSEWYQFQVTALDRLQIEGTTGEVRLAPPEMARSRDTGRRRS